MADSNTSNPSGSTLPQFNQPFKPAWSPQLPPGLSIGQNGFQIQVPVTILAPQGGTGTNDLTVNVGALYLIGTAPQISLTNGNSNWIYYNTSGVAAPTFTTRSVGTKIVLYPNIGAAASDYALGIDSGTLWYSVPVADAVHNFSWYSGTTKIAQLVGDGGTFTLGVANQCQFGFNNTGSAVAGVTPNLLGLAQPSVAWNVAFDQSGNMGLRGGASLATGMRIGAGSSAIPILDGYIRVKPGGADELGTLELNGGALSGGTAGSWQIFTGNSTGSWGPQLTYYYNGTGTLAYLTTAGAIFAYQQVQAGTNNTGGSVLSAGDLGASRSATTGVLILGGITNNCVLDFNIVTGNTLSIRRSGPVYCAINGGLYTNSSDARFKQNIEESPYGLRHVLALKPRTFEMKDTPGVKLLGFIAQEVQPIIPELVSKDDEGYLGVNYDGIIPALVASVQEISARLASVEKKLGIA
jgi:hypothetical protein